MRHSDCTGLGPANDNPKDQHPDLFPDSPLLLGVDFGRDHVVIVAGRSDGGRVRIEHVVYVRRDDGA